MYLFLFKSKVVNLGILAQKSNFYLKLEEGLLNNQCKLTKYFHKFLHFYFSLSERKNEQFIVNKS